MTLRSAIERVVRDVTAILGPEGIAVTFAEDGDAPPELLELMTRRSAPEVEAWIYVPGEKFGYTGIWKGLAELPAPELVVRVADLIQDAIIESGRYWGQGFPPCPEHPGTPVWPAVEADVAIWKCIDGGATRIVIGEWPG